MELSDFAKFIYNTHLKVSRTERKPKPFKARKNFSTLDPKTLFHLRRLESFFIRHADDVNPEDFFRAPYIIYSDVPYFDLEYYSSMKGVRAYMLFKKQQKDLLLQFSKKSVKESLIFIASKCLVKNIRFEDYMTYTTEGGFPLWLDDLRTGKINAYSLLCFPNFVSLVQQTDDEIFETFSFISKQSLLALRMRVNQDKNLKDFLSKSYEALAKFVKKTVEEKKKEAILSFATYENIQTKQLIV